MVEAGLSDATLTSDGMSMAGAGSFQLNPLCGAFSPCVPDDFIACAGHVEPTVPATAGATGSGAASSTGGNANASKGDAGAGGTSGSSTRAGEAGYGGDGNVLLPTIYGCQVQRATEPKGSPFSQCALVLSLIHI